MPAGNGQQAAGGPPAWLLSVGIGGLLVLIAGILIPGETWTAIGELGCLVTVGAGMAFFVLLMRALPREEP